MTPPGSSVGAVPQPGPPDPTNAAYDNNNQANSAKLKTYAAAAAAACAEDETASSSSTAGSDSGAPRPGARLCHKLQLNALWSVWYGFFGTFMMAYIAMKCTKRLIRYSLLPWNDTNILWELQMSLLITVFAIILLPVFLASAAFKIGNFANDGVKIGRHLTPATSATSRALNRGTFGVLWRHGGPTAAILHFIIALSFLVPKLAMEARLIQYNFLPMDTVWKTDLDFMMIHNDRLVVLSFMTAASPPASHMIATPTTAPIIFNNHSKEVLALTDHANKTTDYVVDKSLAEKLFDILKDTFDVKDGDADNIESDIDTGFGTSVSVEYLNFAIALLIYTIRYAAVYWKTNKYFSFIFSFVVFMNGIQTLLSFSGTSVLHKVLMVGPYRALPLIGHFQNDNSFISIVKSPFLLNAQATLLLYFLSSVLVLGSSCILYLYGHARYNAFMSSVKGFSFRILTEETYNNNSCGYKAHGAALLVLIATVSSHAPLLHDLSVTYRGSLDTTVLTAIVADITILFLWVVVWLVLTIKYKWNFNVIVTLGKSNVRSARSVKLVTDIELGKLPAGYKQHQPLLVIGNGKSYTITETQCKKVIMNVVQKQFNNRATNNHTTNQIQQPQQQIQCENNITYDDVNVDEEEQIYWLRPQTNTPPQSSPDSVVNGCWIPRRKSCLKKKHNVKFNEVSCTSVVPTSRGAQKALDGGGPRGAIRGGHLDDDDGDYATLRELPLPLPLLPGVISVHEGIGAAAVDDNVSEEGKLLACVQDDNVTYASTSRDLDPSPLLTPEPLPKVVTIQQQQLIVAAQTPRCLRRADSGIQHEELTPRSDSISTDASTSPPDCPGSNTSETSSGVHSTASSNVQQHRRAASVLDLQHQQQQHVQEPWKSASLQRNVAPPNFNSPSVVLVKPSSSTTTTTANSSGLYGYRSASGKIYDRLPLAATDDVVGIPVVLESSGDEIVIRRKSITPNLDNKNSPEPFGRSTNMRMTTFNECNGKDPQQSLRNSNNNMQSSSATLPHFPTQPQTMASYPHCSTMPLPHSGGPTQAPPALLVAGSSCGAFPRQHTTLPTHHNGVRLFPSTTQQTQVQQQISTSLQNQLLLRRVVQQQYHRERPGSLVDGELPRVVKMIEKK